MALIDTFHEAFSNHGFTFEGPVLQEGKRLTAQTSLYLTHSCGRRRIFSISYQKALKKNFKVCPNCHGAVERKILWTHTELAAKVQTDINATLLGNPDTVYSRQGQEGSQTDEHVRCNVCTTSRHLTLKQLLRGGSNGCSGCAGNVAHDATVVQARAKEYGLTVLNPEIYRGGQTILTYRCDVCDQEFKKKWQNQRKRACAKCERPFGEVMLEALCRFYFASVEWCSQYGIAGIVPDEPATKLYYDLASPQLKLVLENHSEYHLNPLAVKFNGKENENPERRIFFDELKSNAVDKPGSPVYKWKFGVFWFELNRLREMAAHDGTYLPSVIYEFIQEMQKCGHDLKSAPRPIFDDLSKLLNQRKYLDDRAKKRGLTLEDHTWLGRNHPYTFKHTCGCSFRAVCYELEADWLAGRTGCGWCDRTGRLGNWHAFVDQIAAEGWKVLDHTKPSTEFQIVEYSCAKHPEAGTLREKRCKLREWCRVSSKLQPNCPGCRAEIEAEHDREHCLMKVNTVLKPFNEELIKWNLTLIEWDWKGTCHKDEPQSKYNIKCMICGHISEVVIHSTLQKLRKKKRDTRRCDGCRAAAIA